jgi:ankyrin repeat protein
MALTKSRIYSSVNENFILFKACEQGDLKTLENSLNSLSSSDITLIRDNQKATLVHHAARYGHLHILEYLIEKKHLDISELLTEHGATCAHDAAVCDQVEILNYIFHYHQINNHNRKDLFQKLRWTVRDQQGKSPLHLGKFYKYLFTKKKKKKKSEFLF